MKTYFSTGKVKPDLATKNFVERDEVFSDLFGLAYPRHKVEGLSFLPSRMLGSRERDVVKGGEGVT